MGHFEELLESIKAYNIEFCAIRHQNTANENLRFKMQTLNICGQRD